MSSSLIVLNMVGSVYHVNQKGCSRIKGESQYYNRTQFALDPRCSNYGQSLRIWHNFGTSANLAVINARSLIQLDACVLIVVTIKDRQR